MRINVRNMVCNHCVDALRRVLTQSGFTVTDIGLGYAVIDRDELTPADIRTIGESVASAGFELIEGPNHRLVEQVKHEILRHINSEEPCPQTLSHCIADATAMEYKTVSRIFSAIEGRTIEKFYISAKIEKVKELLSYGDVPLSEIAYRLGYSSVAFLSRQFKQETGMTPTQYQHSRHDRRSLADI
ncbi:MAG: AraC family transcriptional regulator [Muribaculaceae bacterium]|nr:AraC family transcriptional regulator [Muribaculaceae bacterium]